MILLLGSLELYFASTQHIFHLPVSWYLFCLSVIVLARLCVFRTAMSVRKVLFVFLFMKVMSGRLKSIVFSVIIIIIIIILICSCMFYFLFIDLCLYVLLFLFWNTWMWLNNLMNEFSYIVLIFVIGICAAYSSRQ